MEAGIATSIEKVQGLPCRRVRMERDAEAALGEAVVNERHATDSPGVKRMRFSSYGFVWERRSILKASGMPESFYLP